MSRWKPPIRVAFSSVALLAGLVLTWHAVGLRSAIGAFLFTFLPLSWPPCVKSVLPLRLPAGYYRLREWEIRPRLYERLGVRLFQRLLRTPLLRILNLDIGRRFQQRDYAKAEAEMRFAETSHVLAFLFALLLSVYALWRHWWDAVAYLITFDVVVNLYPVILQRYNRRRLQALMSRKRHAVAGDATGATGCSDRVR